ncbi:PEP-CTERM sorting domain-containing protein [Aliiglaciecola litoralis]
MSYVEGVDVPEPTSLAILSFGLRGLRLRRKS